MGFFGTIFKAVARGVKSVGGKAFKGLKSAGEAVKRGFKSGVEQIKKGVSKIKNTFTKSKQKKPWKEGDPARFADVGGGNRMAYKGGRPVTGKAIRGNPYAGKPKPKGYAQDTFKYIDNLTDPESLLL